MLHGLLTDAQPATTNTGIRPSGTTMAGHVQRLTTMLGVDPGIHPPGIRPEDIRLTDVSLAPGYGQLNDASVKALQWTVPCEGLVLNPVYTAKAMAGLFHPVKQGKLAGNVLSWHTGGQPALFGYGNALIGPV